MKNSINKQIVIDPDCTTVTAEKLITLWAEYVEGWIDSSKDKYNDLIADLWERKNLKDLLYCAFRTPFKSQADGIIKNLNHYFPGSLPSNFEPIHNKYW